MIENLVDKVMANVQIDDSAVEAHEKELKESQVREIAKRLETHYQKNANVPKRYLNESIDTYIPTSENIKTFEWICGFVDAIKKGTNSKNLVYMGGEFGTGKTHLGCGIIRKLGGMIITSMELCITYDSCRDFNAPYTRIEYLKNLCNEPVLVIDEVGRGITQIEKLILPYIVNEFYGSGKLLVFLGNVSKKDFCEIIGNAGIDRFNEVGVYLSLIGESKRIKTNTKQENENE